MNAPRFVWLDDPTALDQILLTQLITVLDEIADLLDPADEQ